MTRIAIWTAVALLGYGVLVWAAGKSLYYPLRFPAGDWSAQSRLGATDIRISASDGVKLHGWWIPVENSPIVTLHLHGNAGNITHREPVAKAVRNAGSSLLLLDYRGYGKSEGKPSEGGLYRDAAAAYSWLQAQGYSPSHIIVHGESLGTAVATQLASEKKCAGLILEAPFTSAREVAGKVLPLIGPLLVSGFNTLGRIRHVSAPVFVIHGDRDEIIPFAFGDRVYKAANEPKRFWRITGGSHNDMHYVGRLEFSARLKDFYASLR